MKVCKCVYGRGVVVVDGGVKGVYGRGVVRVDGGVKGVYGRGVVRVDGGVKGSGGFSGGPGGARAPPPRGCASPGAPPFEATNILT